MPSRANSSSKLPPEQQQKPPPSQRQPPPPKRHESQRRDFAPPTRTPSTLKSPRQRPSPPQRSDTNHSHYVNMLLSQDTIPKTHTILASVFVWLLLAGFLVFPGTFTSIRESLDDAQEDTATTRAAAEVLKTVKNIPLLVIGAVACGVSAAGMVWLLVRHRVNYVWLLNRLLVPGVANSVAGLISTLVGVYTQQDGSWSITAKVTAIIEGAYLTACAALFGFYTLKLRGVRKRHADFYEKGDARASEEGGIERRKEKEEEVAALQQGASVV